AERGTRSAELCAPHSAFRDSRSPLRASPMSLLIDCYNLIHAAGIFGSGIGPGGLERSRLALLNFIAESLDPAEVPQTTVVFDAAQAPPGLPRTLEHRGLIVRFAAKQASADELIEELIQLDT